MYPESDLLQAAPPPTICDNIKISYSIWNVVIFVCKAFVLHFTFLYRYSFWCTPQRSSSFRTMNGNKEWRWIVQSKYFLYIQKKNNLTNPVFHIFTFLSLIYWTSFLKSKLLDLKDCFLELKYQMCNMNCFLEIWWLT